MHAKWSRLSSRWSPSASINGIAVSASVSMSASIVCKSEARCSPSSCSLSLMPPALAIRVSNALPHARCASKSERWSSTFCFAIGSGALATGSQPKYGSERSVVAAAGVFSPGASACVLTPGVFASPSSSEGASGSGVPELV